MVTLVQVPRYIALLKKYSSKPRVTEWYKSDGEMIEKGEAIVVVETSKASLEIEAPATGLIFILKKVMDQVSIGDTLGVVAKSMAEFEAFQECLYNYPVV
jgi:pyruvate dehydrogenase E2 component (dihydrolipoamide acetyltransferase)